MSNLPTVSLFIPCLVDQVYPEMGMAMVRVLEKLGYTVIYREGQVCCGQPAYNAGHLAESRKVAEHFCSCFDPGDTIVCPSGSCVSMIRNHYETLFDGDDYVEKAMALGTSVMEFTEFLAKENRIKELTGTYKANAVFHCSCHTLRELKLDPKIPHSIFEGIEGLNLVTPEGPHKCCGFGGLFYLKYPAISDAMAKERLDQLLETEVDLIISNDPGCILILRRMLKECDKTVEVVHITELLERVLAG